MIKHFSLFLLFSFFTMQISFVYADLKLEHPECRTVILSDDGSWHFYADETYKFVDVKTVKNNPAEYNAKPVRIKAHAQSLMDNLFLKEDKNDETPIDVNLDQLDKLIVNKILEKCEKGCEVVVKGIFSLNTSKNIKYKSIQASEIILK